MLRHDDDARAAADGQLAARTVADHGTVTMVMKQVTATRFKAQCLALLDEAAAGEEIVVTKRGRPVARVVAVEGPADLEGSVTFHVDADGLVEPLGIEWDAAR
jgi:prevent-host-death family protein